MKMASTLLLNVSPKTCAVPCVINLVVTKTIILKTQTLNNQAVANAYFLC